MARATVELLKKLGLSLIVAKSLQLILTLNINSTLIEDGQVIN